MMTHIQLNYTYNAKKNRLKLFFRPLLILPIVFILNFFGFYNMLNITFESINDFLYNGELFHKDPEVTTVIHKDVHQKMITYEATLNAPQAVVAKGMSRMVAAVVLGPMLASLVFILVLIVDGWLMFLASIHCIIPLDLLIIIPNSYPIWMYNFMKELVVVILKYKMYLFSITDVYPSFYAVDSNLSLELPVLPESLPRWTPLTRRFLIIPHVMKLIILEILWLIVYPFIWLWMIVTGHMPYWFHVWTMAMLKWSLYISCYAILYNTNLYPKFKLSAYFK